MTAKWPASILWGIPGGHHISITLGRKAGRLPCTESFSLFHSFGHFCLKQLWIWGNAWGWMCRITDSGEEVRRLLSFFQLFLMFLKQGDIWNLSSPKKSPVEVNPCYNKKCGQLKKILLRYISIISLSFPVNDLKRLLQTAIMKWKNKLSMEYLRQRSLMETM